MVELAAVLLGLRLQFRLELGHSLGQLGAFVRHVLLVARLCGAFRLELVDFRRPVRELGAVLLTLRLELGPFE